MPYISELLNNKITDSSDAVVGSLTDVLIILRNSSFDPLEFLEVKTSKGQTKFVPYESVANFTESNISLKNLFNKIAVSHLPENNEFVRLKKEVLDQQIVDVAGTRVVRVNDLRIGVFEGKMCVLAIDASFRGLLRRFGFSDSFLVKPFQVRLIDWREAKLVRGSSSVQLSMEAGQLGELHPADLANIVEDLDVKHGSHLLASLDSSKAAKVLEEIDPELQTILVKHLGPERAGKILGQMSSDEFVDLVKTLTEPEARQFLGKVSGGRAQKVEKLLDYADDTAGGLMTVDFVSVRPKWTVQQAIDEIRKVSGSFRSIVHVYITEEDGKFIGGVSVRRLLLAKPDQLMKELAKQFPDHSFLRPSDKIQKIIKLMTKYNLYTAAVLDKEKKLVGMVTIDDVMRHLYPTA